MERFTQLTGQMLLFGLLGRLVYEQPEAERIQLFFAEGVFTESPFGAGQQDIERGLNLLQSWGRDHWERDPAQSLSDLKADHLRLFAGLGRVLAPPWESVYFSDEEQLFQEQTLHVRAWYRQYGLQVEHLHNEPDDHISMELGFLAHLAHFGLQVLLQENEAQAAQLLNAQAAFLSEHLLCWAPRWCALVDEHARTDFYRGVAWLVSGALDEVALMVQAAPASL